MPATWSAESRIKYGLTQLNCAESNFARIARVVGKTRLSEGLAGQNNFDNGDSERMLEILEEMRSLQADVNDLSHSETPIDWSRVEHISTTLALRRLNKADEADERFAQFAKTATEAVAR